MNYYIDTEFHEYKKKVKVLGITVAEIDTIELISIGIVNEHGHTYYAVSKEFDVQAAWDNKWLRENVLKPIHADLARRMSNYAKIYHFKLFEDFSVKTLKRLIDWFGNTNEEIKNGIVYFTLMAPKMVHDSGILKDPSSFNYLPEFYGYYCDYDWVVFCWIWGRMINLPPGFPMYCKDLKQMLDEKALNYDDHFLSGNKNFETTLKFLKSKPGYPKQSGEHHALSDAKWNLELHKFIKELK